MMRHTEVHVVYAVAILSSHVNDYLHLKADCIQLSKRGSIVQPLAEIALSQ